MNRWWRIAGMTAIGVTSCSACSQYDITPPLALSGDPRRGRALLAQYECGVCHVIPGVPGATGRVGPALDAYARRPYVAGKWPNLPEVLVKFIEDPPALAPQTAMPAIPMDVGDAQHMATYLHTLD